MNKLLNGSVKKDLHKKDTPLVHIVSSRNVLTYVVAKKLANILRPLVDLSLHSIRNAQNFVEQVRNIRLEEGECITSYDVKALFTSVSVDPAISISKYKSEQDSKLHVRRTTIHHVTTLLE